MGDRHDRDPSMSDKRDEREAGLARRLLAEAIGTFFLTAVAAGGEIISVTSNGQLSVTAKVIAPGLVVMALIYSLGDISGAHFNPVVTLAFAVRGVFRWSTVPAYWATQLGAAITAAYGLRWLFGNVADTGTPQTHVSDAKALAVETTLTLLLVLVISNTATRARVIGPNAAIAVGGTIALCGLIGHSISGASMNPARVRTCIREWRLDTPAGVRSPDHRRPSRCDADRRAASERERRRGRCRRGRTRVRLADPASRAH